MQALGLIRATEPIFFPCFLAEQAAAGSDDCAVCQHRFPEHQALISLQPLAFACLPPKQACAGVGAAWIETGDAELGGEGRYDGTTTYILIFTYRFISHMQSHTCNGQKASTQGLPALGRTQAGIAAGCKGGKGRDTCGGQPPAEPPAWQSQELRLGSTWQCSRVLFGWVEVWGRGSSELQPRLQLAFQPWCQQV